MGKKAVLKITSKIAELVLNLLGFWMGRFVEFAIIRLQFESACQFSSIFGSPVKTDQFSLTDG